MKKYKKRQWLVLVGLMFSLSLHSFQAQGASSEGSVSFYGEYVFRDEPKDEPKEQPKPTTPPGEVVMPQKVANEPMLKQILASHLPQTNEKVTSYWLIGLILMSLSTLLWANKKYKYKK